MSGVSAVYGWQGGRSVPAKRPECSRAQHASLLKQSGRELFNARKAAYARYAKECLAWGREPADEQTWFQYANAECVRLRRLDDARTSVESERERNGLEG